MKAVFNINLPTSWDKLTDKQLHLVYSLFASDFSTEEIKTICLLKWNGLKILSALQYSRFIIKSGRRKVILTASQIQQATSMLDFLDTIPQMPVRISRIGKHRAVSACFEQLPFEQFVLIENLFQGYLKTQDNNLLQQITKVLYRSDKVKADKAHLIGIFYWMAAIKQYFAREFPNFYQPASNDSSNLLGKPQTSTYQQLRDTTNAMIRALTGGDITKEEIILKTDTWRALTELDALAKEAANLRKLSKK